jgi:predicted dehydrogenase
VYDLLQAVASDRLPEPNFLDGVRNQRVMDAIERAAATRRWIDVRQ